MSATLPRKKSYAIRARRERGLRARLVFFDIDGTLVSGASSEARFARYLWQQRALGARHILAYLWFCLRYFPRYRAHVLKKNKAYLSGYNARHVAALAQAFVADALLPVLHAPTLERLRAHQTAGDCVALLSGTPQFIADALAAALGVEYAIGAACTMRGAHFTVRPPASHPYGPAKIDAAHTLARRAGLPLSRAIAYGDSISDTYLFRVVGEAVVVAPDRRLSAAAVGAGWEVLLDTDDPRAESG
jgi:HAD superfamily hydrolase (TIGR01490 family)